MHRPAQPVGPAPGGPDGPAAQSPGRVAHRRAGAAPGGRPMTRPADWRTVSLTARSAPRRGPGWLRPAHRRARAMRATVQRDAAKRCRAGSAACTSGPAGFGAHRQTRANRRTCCSCWRGKATHAGRRPRRRTCSAAAPGWSAAGRFGKPRFSDGERCNIHDGFIQSFLGVADSDPDIAAPDMPCSHANFAVAATATPATVLAWPSRRARARGWTRRAGQRTVFWLEASPLRQAASGAACRSRNVAAPCAPI